MIAGKNNHPFPDGDMISNLDFSQSKQTDMLAEDWYEVDG